MPSESEHSIEVTVLRRTLSKIQPEIFISTLTSALPEAQAALAAVISMHGEHLRSPHFLTARRYS